MKKDQHHHSSSLSNISKDTKNLEQGLVIIESKGKEFVCLFDAEDSELVCQYNWNLHNKGYAVTSINGKTILMHRLILGITDTSIQVDHKHHNKLDNRRQMLRTCTRSENRRNSRKLARATSKLKGIYKEDGKWHVQIMQGLKIKNLGRFWSEITAAKVYDQKARELFKEFAFLNFPDFIMEKQLVIPGFL